MRIRPISLHARTCGLYFLNPGGKRRPERGGHLKHNHEAAL
jgi:hypothetical protein